MKSKRLSDPYQALEFFSSIRNERQEVLASCFLTARNDVIAVREVFRGTIRGTCASPREILQQALLLNAAGILVAHNHPSGDLNPSDEDIHFTEKLSEATSLMGMILIDHLIVGPGRAFYSLTLRQMFEPAGEFPRLAPDR
jgi:DNA repair protein RadC